MDIYRYLKRFFDLLFSGIGLLLLAPLFLVVAIIIACDSKGPVFCAPADGARWRAFQYL